MKYFVVIIFMLSIASSYAQNIPDTVQAQGLYTEVTIGKARRVVFTGVEWNGNTLNFLKYGGLHSISYTSNVATLSILPGYNVNIEKNKRLLMLYDWQARNKYKVYLHSMPDSNLMHTAAYIHIPSQNKWKYIGSITTEDTTFPQKFSLIKKRNTKSKFTNNWLQRTMGKGWIKADSNALLQPQLRPMSNIDSAQQIAKEQAELRQSTNGATFYNGLYYTIVRQGTGQKILRTDTITVHYKGWHQQTGEVFDQTKEKPATFPLQRLIEGWQIAVPLLQVGGKIRMYLPSGLAYGIRQVSPVIMPNSTLVFEVEVLERKPTISQ
jgi:FKBP-type peptidyl-prolyl cis-trans isomerase